MKTAREYDELFEDLMTYTDFSDPDDLVGETRRETQQNLNDFFTQLRRDAEQRGADGRKFFSPRFTRAMAVSLGRLFREPAKKKEIREAKVFVKEVEKVEFKIKGLVREQRVIRGKKRIQFRDAKTGRFVKKQ